MDDISTNPASPVELLRKHFGYQEFRNSQQQVIDHVLSGNHAIEQHAAVPFDRKKRAVSPWQVDRDRRSTRHSLRQTEVRHRDGRHFGCGGEVQGLGQGPGIL